MSGKEGSTSQLRLRWQTHGPTRADGKGYVDNTELCPRRWAARRPCPSALSPTFTCPRPLDLLTLTSRGSRVNTVLSEGGWGTCESLPCCCAGNQTWASWKCTLREDTSWSPSTGHLPRAGPGESGGHTSWERVTRAGGRREQ